MAQLKSTNISGNLAVTGNIVASNIDLINLKVESIQHPEESGMISLGTVKLTDLGAATTPYFLVYDNTTGQVCKGASVSGLMSADDKKNLTYYVKGTQTASTNAWTGELAQVSALYEGLTIRYRLPYAGTSSGATLNLTLSDGTMTGAQKIYRYGTSTQIAKHFAAGSIITMTYDGTNWIVDAFYYTGDGKVRQYQHGENEAVTTNQYPLLARYGTANKNGSYESNYSRFHTEAYVDISDGSLTAKGFKYNGATGTDSYVLLAGGGTKAVSDFAMDTDVSDFIKGPASATDNAVVRFDATTGKLIQNSGVTIDDSNNLTIPGKVVATTIKKTGGADTHILLAGGGTKAISDFQPAGNYLTKEEDTLQSVTDRGATTTKTITANGFKHSDTTRGNNSYILLAGGGTKAISDFLTSGDTTVVKTSGAQTIAGQKTFSDEIIASSGIKASLFTSTSDARLKENFSALETGDILSLPTYKFNFIDGPKSQIGCKAQDLQQICPEIVQEGEDGYLSIQESKIVYLLLEEMKKMRKEIDELKRR